MSVLRLSMMSRRDNRPTMLLRRLGLIAVTITTTSRSSHVHALQAVFPIVGRANSIVGATSTSRFMSRPSNTFNPFRMVGDVASGLLGSLGVGDMESKPQVEKAIVSMLSSSGDLLSWKDIRQNLEQAMETEEERNFRTNLPMGYGVGSPLHKIRLYDESNQEEDILVTFYRGKHTCGLPPVVVL